MLRRLGQSRGTATLVVAGAGAVVALYALRRWRADRQLAAARRKRSRIKSLPKVELHVHLDGAFDTELLYNAAKTRIAELPERISRRCAACADVHAFEALVTCPRTERSLQAMLDRFDVFLPIVQGQIELLEQLAYAFVHRQADMHVLYTEVRYSPHLLTAEAATYGGGDGASAPPIQIVEAAAATVIDAVTRGLRRGVRECPNVEVNQIICCLDRMPEYAQSVVTLAHARRAAFPCAVVGVDIAAGEAHFHDAPPASGGAAETGGEATDANGPTHRAAMRRAAALDLPITLHAGESGPTGHVLSAASGAYGSARRVGHGYALAYEMLERMGADAKAVVADPAGHVAAAVSALRAMGVPVGLHFETCPTSSLATGAWTGEQPWAHHPTSILHRLRKAAIDLSDAAAAAAIPSVSISSDDPAVFSVSLADELQLALSSRGMALGPSAVKDCANRALDAAFIADDARAALRQRLDMAYAAWERAPI